MTLWMYIMHVVDKDMAKKFNDGERAAFGTIRRHIIGCQDNEMRVLSGECS